MKTYTLESICKKCGVRFNYERIELRGSPRAYCDGCRKTKKPQNVVKIEGTDDV